MSNFLIGYILLQSLASTIWLFKVNKYIDLYVIDYLLVGGIISQVIAIFCATAGLIISMFDKIFLRK